MASSPQKMFRTASLERLSSPEQLDQIIQVTRPRSWIALAGICAVLAVTVVWGLVGSIPTKVDAQGMLIKPGGVFDVFSNGTGQVTDVAVKEGDTIREGQVVARLDQPQLTERIRQAEAQLAELLNQHAQLSAFTGQDAKMRADGLAVERTKLQDAIAFAKERQAALKEQLNAEEQLLQRGLITRAAVLQTQQAYFGASDLLVRSTNDLKQLAVTELGANNQKEQLLQKSQLSINEVRRTLQSLERELQLTSQVASPYSGRILELKVRRGDLIGRGGPVVSLQLLDSGSHGLEAIIYVPPAGGKGVKPGMAVQLSPLFAPRQEYGYLVGKVTYVSEFPATREGMMRVLANEAVVAGLAAQGAPFAVYAELIPDPASSNGYRWSSPKGNPLSVNSGTICAVSITTRTRRPIDMVIPLIREYTGL